MEATIEFLKHLKTWQIEFNNLNQTLHWNDVKDNTADNIYFLSWVKEWLDKRAGDDDIVSKNYFCIDLDIRNQCDFEVTDEEIKKEWMNIAENLIKEDNMLWLWRYIVFSWNGLHIYYTFEEKSFDKEVYAQWVESVYEDWDNFWWDKIYKSDRACKNLARILRLPWSVNQKNWATVEIIAEQGTDCKYNIQQRWETRIAEIQEEKEREIKKRAEEYEEKMKLDMLIQWKKYESNQESTQDLFDKIDAIPAYIVSEKLLPQFKFANNNKNFLSDNPNWNKFTAFYYKPDYNAIFNWGSRHYNFWETGSWYSPSVLVKNHLWLEWKEVVRWFRENFKI